MNTISEITPPESDRKKAAFQVTKKAVAGWLAVFFIISAWMFVLGIFVGRGTAPVTFELNKLQKELASLREAVIKKEKESIKADADAYSNMPDVDFHEALKKSGGSVDMPVLVDRSESRVPQNISKDVSVKETAVAVAKKERDTSVDREADETKKFTIQVSAVKDLKTADKLVARLKEKGYPAYRIDRKTSGTEVWHRVRVGYFRNKAEAQSMIQRLKKEKYDPVLMNR